MWFEYFVICKVTVNANFLRFNICVWRAKLSLIVLGRFNLILLYTYLTLFRKIDFYLVLEDKSRGSQWGSGFYG